VIVIAATTPLNYLILIDSIDTLPRLYGRMTVPQAVFDELLTVYTDFPQIQSRRH
jgi:predicted nucleic acid-binding protein